MSKRSDKISVIFEIFFPSCREVTAVTDDRSVVIRWRKSETWGQTGQSGVKHVTTQWSGVMPYQGNTGYYQ